MMKNIWDSIINKLDEISPEIKEGLNKGIDTADVLELEKVINVKLPVDFINFYKTHNGQDFDSPGLIDCEQLLPFEGIIGEWQLWKSLEHDFVSEDGKAYESDPKNTSIKNDWWNSLWIPITQDGSGNHYCLDLDPTESGNYGQIIRMWHDDAERSLESTSFKEWISDYTKKLLNDELVYTDDYGGIISKKELKELEEGI